MTSWKPGRIKRPAPQGGAEEKDQDGHGNQCPRITFGPGTASAFGHPDQEADAGQPDEDRLESVQEAVQEWRTCNAQAAQGVPELAPFPWELIQDRQPLVFTFWSACGEGAGGALHHGVREAGKPIGDLPQGCREDHAEKEFRPVEVRHALHQRALKETARRVQLRRS